MYPVQTRLFALILAVPISVFAAGLEKLIEDCDGCHGPQGVSANGDVPSIAGQTAEFLTGTLASYKEWGRPCRKTSYRFGNTSRPATTMCAIAENLSGEEMEALGSYYAGLPFIAAKQDFDQARAASGAQLYQAHCETCHPEGGRVPGRGPILAGQWAPYLKVAAREAITGEHLVPPFMEKQLSDFSDEEIDALINFFASRQN
jgi:sulfide dehydrogenase cytochrome subunit